MSYINEETRRRRRSVRLIFKRTELIYDIENYSFVEGDIMGDDNEHATHQVFDIAQGGNADRVTRVLGLAFSECVEMLYPYSKETLGDEQETLDDILVAPEQYALTLSLPDTFSATTVRLLKDLIHEFLVCSVLADWMSITKPKAYENWKMKMETMRDKIRTCIVSRCSMVRRKLKPF